METTFVRYTFISLFIHRHNILLQNEHINPIQPVARHIFLIIIYITIPIYSIPYFVYFLKPRLILPVNCPS